ncbi:type III polyketide synthase [Microvirga brassicacearum]|uniref:Type III polyketide synthase n=1 Tax=Microvirga brassicacearum TaxID=2580413 RepID=A0A5N3P9T1_9HYPH|nr:type III polyketide synthase [Microvirga brassicacearum]
MQPSAHLMSVATAVPPHILKQDEAAALAHEIFASRYGDFVRLSRVFETSGIRQRHAVRPLEWYATSLGWPERTAVYLEGAESLFVDSATRALAGAGCSAQAVDTVVTVSSTGIATPSLDARVMGRMGFRPDVSRVPVFGLGCAGGVTGLSIAARLATARPGTNVLLVVVELCTLAFRMDELTKANVVASALFGDGAAACILRAGEGGLARIDGAGEYTWPDTLDIMGWNVDPQGFGVVFAQAIPPFAKENVGPAITAILARSGRRLSDIDRFVCHPGGRKVIMALESALRLDAGSLDHERDVLDSHGNMSAPTVLFVLERVIASGLPELSAVNAMGPGFSTSCVVLTRVP